MIRQFFQNQNFLIKKWYNIFKVVIAVIGIYKITNKINGKSYIGQSIDIERRFREHRKSKDDSLIDNDIRKYGQDVFTFEILEECPSIELNRRERYYIEKFKSHKKGYNQTAGSTKDKRMSVKENRFIIQKVLDNNFIMLKWEDYTAAARELSPSALNLYMYLAKNQDNYELWFSSKDYCNTFKVVDKTFRNAKAELLRKGYLREGENNKVYFDAAGGYKETKAGLVEELKELGNQLKVEDIERYEKLVEVLTEAKLSSIEDETVYILEIKQVISFAKDLLKEISSSEIEGLL